MIAAAFLVLTAYAGTAKAHPTDHEAKLACLQQDPQLKGKALRTCMKAKRAK